MFTVKSTPHNCYELFKLGFTSNGVYEVFPDKGSKNPVVVYCEMELGGWTTLVNKVDRSVFFNRPMKAFINGFGNVSANTNYWLGLDNMFDLTNNEIMTLRMEMSNSRFDKYFIEYDLFVLAPQIEKFKLTLGKTTFRTIRDSFASHNNMKFTTYDEDNDLDPSLNCAKEFNSGWWFSGCYEVCLTGEHNGWGHWYMNDKSMGVHGIRHFSLFLVFVS